MSQLFVDNIKNRTGGAIGAPSGAVVTGVATATQFSGNVTGVAATFTGNVSVGGVLTYEDVTNIDSIGFITARSGIKFGLSGVGGTITATGQAEFVGIVTAKSDVSIADKIIHTGDTNTAIRFPAADTFTVETAGSEAIRVDSGGRLVIGSSGRTAGDVNAQLQVEGTSFATSSLNLISNAGASAGNVSHITLAKSRGSADGSNTIVANGDNLGSIQFAGADGTDINSTAALISAAVDGTPGTNDMPGRLMFHTTADGASSSTERMRIHSGGVVSFNNGIELGSGLDATAANTLDDYEEGTWTPTVTASGGTITSATASGEYTKIGNIVRFQLSITISNVGSGTGTLISTLPFNPANANWAASGAEDVTAGYTCIVFGNGTNVFIRKYDYSTAIVNGHRLKIAGTFQV